ncbi:hypothetical protein CHU98_g5002 [Xylaria longipes]|nr:hypothetical protein CHU98_g5002 [Xylaria longipes]
MCGGCWNPSPSSSYILSDPLREQDIKDGILNWKAKLESGSRIVTTLKPLPQTYLRIARDRLDNPSPRPTWCSRCRHFSSGSINWCPITILLVFGKAAFSKRWFVDGLMKYERHHYESGAAPRREDRDRDSAVSPLLRHLFETVLLQCASPAHEVTVIISGELVSLANGGTILDPVLRPKHVDQAVARDFKSAVRLTAKLLSWSFNAFGPQREGNGDLDDAVVYDADGAVV